MRRARIIVAALVVALGVLVAAPAASAHEYNSQHPDHGSYRTFMGCGYWVNHQNYGTSIWSVTAVTSNQGGCDTVGTRVQVISRLHVSGGDHQYQTSSWKYSGSQAWVTINGWDSMQSWVTLKSWHKAESSSTGQWITYTNL